MLTFDEIKISTEILSYLSSPILAFFAWKMLEQLKIGSAQVKAAADQIITSKKISEIQTKREAMKIASEQAVYFAEKIIPEISKFLKLKEQNKYPILSKAEVIEDWPNIQCKTNDISGLIREIYSNEGLVVKTLNKIEGFSMFFACGVADADTAYKPLCTSFCGYIKNFLPYLIVVHEKHNQFSHTMSLYGAWGMRKHVEHAEKEISKHKEHLSKIKVPEIKPFGTENNC